MVHEMTAEPPVDSPRDESVSPILRIEDAELAVAWYTRLGFAAVDVHRFGPDMPAFVTIRRGPIQLFLSEHTGDARPDTLVYLSVRDVDPVAAEFGVAVEYAPWGREVELEDPDGNRIRIGSPLPAGSESPVLPSSGDHSPLTGESGVTTPIHEAALAMVIRDVIGALYRGDFTRLGECLDPHVVWEGPRPELRCEGHQEVLRYWRSALAWITADITHLEVLEGSRGVVIGVQGRAREDMEPEFTGQRHLVLTMADGRITMIEEMDRRTDALAAAGISDHVWR